MDLMTPLDDSAIAAVRAGDVVTLSGVVYGARDAAHQRMAAALERGEALPVDLRGQAIYYVGPAPAKPGHVIGPAGPTTSGRMDPYTEAMLAQGVRAFIGKGYRSEAVKAALLSHRALYLAAVGGAAALLARHIVASRVVAYADLGPEAIYEFVFERFPAVVVHDIYGGDGYARARLSTIER